MNSETEKNYFKSCDLALVTSISLFYSIESTSRETSGKVWFSFCRDEQLDTLLETYWKGELRVEPQIFFNQLRVIKSRIYSSDNTSNLSPVDGDESGKLRR